MITNKSQTIKKKKSPLLAFCFAKQRQKIKFPLENRLASPRRGRASNLFFQLAEGLGFEPRQLTPSPVFKTGSLPFGHPSANTY